jgi:hypothetical protein
MASSFPNSLDNFSNPTSGDKLDSPSHSSQHGDANDAIEGLEKKIGIGASSAGSATAGFPLVHSSGGTTAWAQVGYEGITSGTATAGQLLRADGSGAAAWATSTQGLTLINTTPFTSVSSVSVPDNTFTATYDNYFALYVASFGTVANTTLRLRAAGSDLSSGLYRFAAHYVATNADHLLDTGNTQTSGKIISANLNRHTAQITFFNPFLTANTQFDVQAGGGRDATVFASAQYGTNEYDATTSADAFTLIFSQTGTGVVSVYGFNK